MKRLLIVSDCPTHPVIGGNRMCILEYARMLRSEGFDVWFLLAINGEVSHADVIETANAWGDRFLSYLTPSVQMLTRRVENHISHCNRSVDFLYPRGLNRFIEKQHRRLHFDGMIVNYIWMSRAALTSIPVKALFTHDVFAFRREKINGYFWRSYSVGEEAKAVRRFENILAIQDNESTYYSYLAPQSRVSTVYSSFSFVDQPLSGSTNVLFFSGGGVINHRAITAFLANVWPTVIAAVPDARLLIGGKISDLLRDTKLPKGVDVQGLFDNPADFYRQGDIAINPITEGTGLKIKTMEAIAYGKVTITTPHSADGVFDKQHAPIEIAADDADFALRIISNLRCLNRQDNKAYIRALNQHIINQYKAIFC